MVASIRNQLARLPLFGAPIRRTPPGSPSSALVPVSFGEGPPTKIDKPEKCRVPTYCNLQIWRALPRTLGRIPLTHHPPPTSPPPPTTHHPLVAPTPNASRTSFWLQDFGMHELRVKTGEEVERCWFMVSCWALHFPALRSRPVGVYSCFFFLGVVLICCDFLLEW